MLDTAGPIDEGYFMYFEEIDYQLAATDEGWSFEIVPEAVVWQRSSRRESPLAHRNRLRLVARYGSRIDLLQEIAAQARLVISLVSRRQIAEARDVASGLCGWLLRRDPRGML